VVVAAVLLVLRWHIVSIEVLSGPQSSEVTIYEFFTTASNIRQQLAAELGVHLPSSGSSVQELRLVEALHATPLPLSKLVSPDWLPRLQRASPDAPPRQFRM
jgi:hypothetical protein